MWRHGFRYTFLTYLHYRLLFSNPVWGGADTVPTTIIRNITALSVRHALNVSTLDLEAYKHAQGQVAYEQTITQNMTTLTMTNADTVNGIIQGLLYVPDLTTVPSCDEQQYDFIPRNVTRQAELPPTPYNLIALAPWFSMDCTLAYLASASLDPIRAFVFYKPNNSTSRPQDASSPVWNLNDNGQWKTANRFPIFAVPGLQGQRMMTQLSYYSGNITEVPHGDEINQLYGPSPSDYVRIWTELSIHTPSGMPALWSYFLIVIGALLLIVTTVSLTMHMVQRRRRKSLERRVESGDVDLEAMGIKRITVPVDHVKSFPLFTYNADADLISTSTTPGAGSATATRSVKSKRSRRQEQRSVISDIQPPSVRSTRSVRSKRSTLTDGADMTATNNQPKCHICLEDYAHRQSIIRELPCGHIFHPECIDEFLSYNSSLCPTCKHCMLPRGYSPKITNGMVRRERALRRLRERVVLDDASEMEQGTVARWVTRIFMLPSKVTPSILPLSSLRSPQEPGNRAQKSTSSLPDSSNPSPPAPDEPSEDISEASEGVTRAPNTRLRAPRKGRARGLRTLPTQPEDSELKTGNRKESPSSFARARMQEIAAKNAPFDDPDRQQAQCKLPLSKKLSERSLRCANSREQGGVYCQRCFLVSLEHSNGGVIRLIVAKRTFSFWGWVALFVSVLRKAWHRRFWVSRDDEDLRVSLHIQTAWTGLDWTGLVYFKHFPECGW
jgi:hypothetical protein